MATVRIPAALAARAHRWVATYMAAAPQGTAPVTDSPAARWSSRSPRSLQPSSRERGEEV
jgi:hypothetical protein